MSRSTSYKCNHFLSLVALLNILPSDTSRSKFRCLKMCPIHPRLRCWTLPIMLLLSCTVWSTSLLLTRRLAPSPLVRALREHCWPLASLPPCGGGPCGGGCRLPSVTASRMDHTRPALLFLQLVYRYWCYLSNWYFPFSSISISQKLPTFLYQLLSLSTFLHNKVLHSSQYHTY